MTIYTSEKVLPYVYICANRESGQFYIGYRCANTKPSHIDLPKYKTSSKRVNPVFEQFDWIIIAEFFDNDSAYDFEQEFIYENWNSPLILNKSCCYKSKSRFRNRRGTPCPEHVKKMNREYRTGIKMSEETKEKLSNSKKGTTHSEESKRKMSMSQSGELHWNYGKTYDDNKDKEYKEKLSNAKSKTYKVINPSGEELVVKNLTKFCKEHGLHVGNMVQVSKGKYKTSNGWKCFKI